MDGRTNPPTRKELPPRFALITPSASPPSSRASYASRARKTDRAPSAKRPRLASTPSSSFSASTPSSSARPDVNQIDEDRRASSQRLMSFWSQLGERYNRPLDEDDIIDLRDGSLLKDRGVLSGVDHIYNLGFFAAGDGASDANANDTASEGGGPPETEDDDVDEIDAFTPEANISDELEMEKEKLHVPPVRAMDPADAEDLREFLEAEQQRKGLHDDEEDEEVDPMLLRGAQLDWRNVTLEEDGNDDESEGEGEGGDVYDGDGERVVTCEEEEGKDVYLVAAKAKVPVFQETLLRVDSDDESEDEFATWDFDASTPAPRPRANRQPPEDDVIDLTDFRSPSPPPPRRAMSKAPARGRSTPASRARSKSRPRAKSKSPARNEVKTPLLPSPKPIIQLFTPPRSAMEITPDVLQSCDIEYPSPPPPPRVRPRPTPISEGGRRSTDSPAGSSTAIAPPQRLDLTPEARAPKAKSTKTSKTVLNRAEVVLTRRSRRLSATNKTPDCDSRMAQAQRQDEHSNDEDKAPEPERRIPRKDKGKGKDLPDSVDSFARSDSEQHPNGQTTDSGPKKVVQKATPKFKAKAKEKSEDIDAEPCASSGPAPRGGKRKRIVSSSSLSGQSAKDELSIDWSPVAPAKARGDSEKKRKPGPVRASGDPAQRKTSVSPSRSGDDSEGISEQDRRGRSHAHSRAPQMPPPDSYGFMYPPPMAFPPQHHDKHAQYQPTMVPDPQAQFRIAQAIHHLSYLMNATAAASPGQGYPPGYPPPYPMPSSPWPPFTPPHRHRSQHRHAHEPLSSEAGSSALSPTYAVPPHAYPFPYPFNPMFSDSTLPPSSPPPPSEPSSPIEARARSKSRGRRVSFKLDDNDRPLPTTPRRDDKTEGTTHLRRGHRDDPEIPSARPRGRSKSSVRETSGRSSQQQAAAAAKGKGRAVVMSDESAGEDEAAALRGRARGSKAERARTPGPPSQEARGTSARPRGQRAAAKK